MVTQKLKPVKNERNRSVDVLAPLAADLSWQAWSKSGWDNWANRWYDPPFYATWTVEPFPG